MKIHRLKPERNKLIACDECGKMYKPQAIREIKIARVPYFLYLCPCCARDLGQELRGDKRAG